MIGVIRGDAGSLDSTLFFGARKRVVFGHRLHRIRDTMKSFQMQPHTSAPNPATLDPKPQNPRPEVNPGALNPMGLDLLTCGFISLVGARFHSL